MSRIGKLPINIPAGVTVTVGAGNEVVVKGPKGELKQVVNPITQEEIFILTICSNELTFDVSINIIDLFGEPQVGRRFKGSVWLQGRINYPEQL